MFLHYHALYEKMAVTYNSDHPVYDIIHHYASGIRRVRTWLMCQVEIFYISMPPECMCRVVFVAPGPLPECRARHVVIIFIFPTTDTRFAGNPISPENARATLHPPAV